MIRTICILFHLILLLNKSYAQVYSARFECLLGSQLGATDTSSNSNAGNFQFPLITRISYELQADKNYIYLNSKIISSMTIPVGEVENKAAYSRMIIDLKKGIAYFPNEKEYKKVKQYQLKGVCADDSTASNLIGVDTSVQVKLSRKIPWFVSPGVILTNTEDCGGVTYIKTSDYTFKLISYKVSENGSLNYSSHFSKIGIDSIKTWFEFFE